MDGWCVCGTNHTRVLTYHILTHPQCQTRTGKAVRCLATIGVHIDDVGACDLFYVLHIIIRA